MADPVATMTAGSAGGSPPRRENALTLNSNCQSAPDAEPRPRRKGRGVAQGNDLSRHVKDHGKITITWETELDTYKGLGQEGTWYYTGLGISIRDCTEPCHATWEALPADQKMHARERMLDWFVLDFDDALTRTIFNRDCSARYRDFKNRVHTYFKKQVDEFSVEEVRTKPPAFLKDSLHWEHCIQRFLDPTFQAQSERNSNNRKHLRWNSYHGRKSYAQHREKKRKTAQAGEGAHDAVNTTAVKTWADLHKRGDTWANAEAEAATRLMDDRIAQATQQAVESTSESSVHVDQHSIMSEVLGRRRGHIPGVGPSLPSTSTSAASYRFQPSSTHARELADVKNEVVELKEMIRMMIMS